MNAEIPAALIAQADSKGLLNAVQDVVDAYNRSGHGDRFQAISSGGRIVHVVPKEVRRPDGIFESYEPLLSTLVSLPARQYRLGELVSEILAQIGNRRGVQITRATVPVNLFAQTTVTERAENEPARQVLLRAFSEMNSKRLTVNAAHLDMAWYLMYSADSNLFYFNVHVVKATEWKDFAAETDEQRPAVSVEPGRYNKR